MAQIIDACSHVYHAAFTATATLSNQGRMDRIIQFLDTFVMVKIKKNKHIALIKVYNLNKNSTISKWSPRHKSSIWPRVTVQYKMYFSLG